MTGAASLSEVLPPEALAQGDRPASLAPLAARAEAVVHPRSTEEVTEALRWATAHRVGVLPVASGERVGSVPSEGRFIVLATDRLVGLEIYEPADVTLTARAGTPLVEIRDALAQHRQWLPFDPPHVERRTLGGLVARGESGAVGTGYGELRNHVLGATVVCGDGRVLHLGGRVVKNVAGFDLLRPVVGSRGRLGVITSVCLRAFPVPGEDRVLVHRAESLSALADVARAVCTAPVLPCSVVACDGLDALEGRAALVVRLNGAPATVDADQVTLERHSGTTFERVDDGADLLRGLRSHAASGAVRLQISLLPSRLFEGLAAVRDRVGDAPVAADVYGGTARFAVGGATAETIRDAQEAVEALGGVLSVAATRESGVEGLGSRPSAEELDLASRLERVFDPERVLWPCRT